MAVHVEWAAPKVRKSGRRDPRRITQKVALGDSRWRALAPVLCSRRGNMGLSRFVTRMSRPKMLQVPASPNSSSALISSSDTACGLRDTAARAAGKSERQRNAGSALTSSLVRPDNTDAGWSSGFQPSTAKSSCLCSSIHCSLPSRSVAVRTSTRRPRSFWPYTSAWISPAATAATGSSAPWSCQVPVSQTMTSPPPYSPLGITPSKCKYSSGWSSTWTAMRRTPGSSVGPLGTAQLASVPSISRRRS